jgi:hypothetical protein
MVIAVVFNCHGMFVNRGSFLFIFRRWYTARNESQALDTDTDLFDAEQVEKIT